MQGLHPLRFSSYLRDGFVYDAALLNAIGGGYATTEYTGDTLYAIVVAFGCHLGSGRFCTLHTLVMRKQSSSPVIMAMGFWSSWLRLSFSSIPLLVW